MTVDAIVIPDIDYTRCEKPKKTHDEWIKAHVKPGDPKMGDKLHKFTPCHYMTKDARMPNTPLTGITDDMGFTDQKGDYHHFLIVNGDVFMNGSIIASAPVYGDNRRKKTVAQQHTFCKAVIWSLWNDDSALNEYAAKYPLLPAAVPTVTAVPEVITEPVRDILPILAEGLGLTHEEYTGYPIIDLMPDLESKISADIQEMVNEASIQHYDGLDQEFQHETDDQIIAAFIPINPVNQVIRQWNYRGMQIREETIVSC